MSRIGEWFDEDIEPSDLLDPKVWLGGLVMFLAIAAFCVFAGIVW